MHQLGTQLSLYIYSVKSSSRPIGQQPAQFAQCFVLAEPSIQSETCDVSRAAPSPIQKDPMKNKVLVNHDVLCPINLRFFLILECSCLSVFAHRSTETCLILVLFLQVESADGHTPVQSVYSFRSLAWEQPKCDFI